MSGHCVANFNEWEPTMRMLIVLLLGLSALTDVAVLTEMLDAALRCDSLKEFEALLPTKG